MEFKTLLTQITTLFQNFTRKQQIVAALSVLFVVGFIVFLLLFRSQDSMIASGYSVLFERTSPSDSALIIQQLEKDKVPYKIINEGTIAVPSSDVYKQRIAIAALGIPKDSKVGFEIFNKNEFGATDFEQRIKYLRALEGELSRTIESLNPILSASVHIAIAKETLFVEKKTPTTASILVSLAPGTKLTTKQVLGIKNLVSSSIADLSAQSVSIVDQNGVSLGTDDADGYTADFIKAQMSYKRDFESAIEDKILNVLTPVIGGSDKVVAKVTIDFDFAREDSTSEVYDPNSVPRSEQSVEEKKDGTTTQDTAGVPGAVSNIGPVQGLDNNKASEKYEKSSTTTNYEISKTVTNTKGEFAKIKKISAAVVVDGYYDFDTDAQGNKSDTLTFKPLSAEQMNSINAIVRQAVGFDEARGDEVTVSNLQFKQLSLGSNKPATQTFIDQVSYYSAPLVPLLKYLIAAILLFVFYKKVINPFREKMVDVKSSEYSLEDYKSSEDIDDEDSAEDTLEKFKKARKKVEDQLGISNEFSEDELKYDVLLEKLKNLSDAKSEEVAGLLQMMIRNESDYDTKGVSES